ncbi:selenide, water dikinase [Candidatus Uabimicrobium amorphum]|uniref:Selenide, water dikinase n=1 Tax=Uabimicrobium amorphum TaxID=2596890 RepID=A0A5S9F7I5_UABAM|nr:selenide, water dikinase [Candidatus Uabimicrobium amorphum]
MTEVLRYLPIIQDPNVLVAAETADDGGVYKITPEIALVVTLDYFTPIVDDPYSFGMIAAANALSDVYAMGGTPITMLNMIGFPKNTLPFSVLGEIVKGGAEKAQEAGVNIIGGHSIDDSEPKFGFVAIGTIHPQKILRNSTAQVGDTLVLTKPLGTGIVSTAIKRQKISDEMIAKSVNIMATLNKAASEAMQEAGANACTDVTGYGLLGHLNEMVKGSKVAAKIYLDAIPFIDGVRELAEDGFIPGGTRRNLEAVMSDVNWEEDINAISQLLLADAQTSGGLLISVNQDHLPKLREGLQKRNVSFAEIGEIVAGSDIHVMKGK